MTDNTSPQTEACSDEKKPTGVPGRKPVFSEDTLNLFRIIICIALLIPVVQLYFTIPAAISVWVADQYVPFVNMIYFIIVIAVGLWILRYTFTLSGSRKEK